LRDELCRRKDFELDQPAEHELGPHQLCTCSML
jgi:hypothetical protein